MHRTNNIYKIPAVLGITLFTLVVEGCDKNQVDSLPSSGKNADLLIPVFENISKRSGVSYIP